MRKKPPVNKYDVGGYEGMMKKILIIILALGLLVVALASSQGCSNEVMPTDNTTVVVPVEDYTITWNKYEKEIADYEVLLYTANYTNVLLQSRIKTLKYQVENRPPPDCTQVTEAWTLSLVELNTAIEDKKVAEDTLSSVQDIHAVTMERQVEKYETLWIKFNTFDARTDNVTTDNTTRIITTDNLTAGNRALVYEWLDTLEK